jgi:hypothetical protein
MTILIKFVSDLRQSVIFSGTPVSSTNKTDRNDITEILLKVVLNTKILTPLLLLLQ